MSVASEITRLQTAKADLKTAIEGKGVTVSSSAKLDAYPALVESISGGGDDDNWYLLCGGNNENIDDYGIFLFPLNVAQNTWEYRYPTLLRLPPTDFVVSFKYKGENYYANDFKYGTFQLSKQGSPVTPTLRQGFLALRITKKQDGTFELFILDDD